MKLSHSKKEMIELIVKRFSRGVSLQLGRYCTREQIDARIKALAEYNFIREDK